MHILSITFYLLSAAERFGGSSHVVLHVVQMSSQAYDPESCSQGAGVN